MANTVSQASPQRPGDMIWGAAPAPAASVLDWCLCGILNCPDGYAHDFGFRSAETTWREAAVRPFPGTARARDFSARRAAA